MVSPLSLLPSRQQGVALPVPKPSVHRHRAIDLMWNFLTIAFLATPLQLQPLLFAPTTAHQEVDSEEQTIKSERGWLLENVHVLQPEENSTPTPLQYIRVSKNRIESIGSMDNAPDDESLRRIDGQGKFISPGFVDAHGHLLRSKDGWDEKSIQRSYIDCLRFGVLYVRSMRGVESDPALRAKIREGLWLGPELVLGAPPISSRNVKDLDEPSDWLLEQKAKGFDFVKCLSGLDGKELREWTQASHALKMPWFGHAPKSGLQGAVAGHMDGVEHISPFVRAYLNEEENFPNMLLALGENGVSHSASLMYYERLAQRVPTDQLAKRPGMNLVPATVREQWQTELEELAPRKQAYANMVDQYLTLQEQLVNAGIPILISPSAGPFILPGYSYQDEVALLQKGGMTPSEIWRAATYTAFAHTPLPKGMGPVETGAIANFVLLATSPLESTQGMGQVLGVSLRGQWMSERELEDAANALSTGR